MTSESPSTDRGPRTPQNNFDSLSCQRYLALGDLQRSLEEPVEPPRRSPGHPDPESETIEG